MHPCRHQYAKMCAKQNECGLRNRRSNGVTGQLCRLLCVCAVALMTVGTVGLAQPLFTASAAIQSDDDPPEPPEIDDDPTPEPTEEVEPPTPPDDDDDDDDPS